MTFSTNQYIPILKWRMGEYQALLRLDDAIKDKVVPLIVIPPIEYDFEEQCDKKTVEEHISTFARRFQMKWGNRHALLDLHKSLELATRDSGELAVTSIFRELRHNKANVIPVFGINRSKQYLDCIKSIKNVDDKGACLRVVLADLIDPDFADRLSDALDASGMQPSALDLVIDIQAPKNFEPYPNFSAILTNLIPNVGKLEEYRSFAVVATAFPESLAIAKPGGTFPRHEWWLYQVLVNELSEAVRVPAFGDYGMERPEFIRLDMRLVKPAGKVVYTTPTDWLICKGGSFRDDPKQMRKHCRKIVGSGLFQGEAFSDGDKFIKECADGIGTTGNLTRWKSVGMNHHMTQVVGDLATFHGA